MLRVERAIASGPPSVKRIVERLNNAYSRVGEMPTFVKCVVTRVFSLRQDDMTV